MRKIKIFKSVESELHPLEDEVNGWLQESGVKLVSVTGNIAPQTQTANSALGSFASSDVLLIVVYEEADG